MYVVINVLGGKVLRFNETSLNQATNRSYYVIPMPGSITWHCLDIKLQKSVPMAIFAGDSPGLNGLITASCLTEAWEVMN